MLHLSEWTILILNDINYFIFFTILVHLILIFYYYKSKSASNKLLSLPGPRGFPIIGYFPFLGPKLHLTVHKLTKKYGPILRIQVGSVPCLFLCGFEAIREALVKQSHIYSNRPKNTQMKVYENESAFIFDDGATFKDVRMFSMNIFKKLGFGRLSLENDVKLEVQDLINKLKKLNEQPIDVSVLMAKSAGNAVCTLLHGKRSTYDDPWLIRLIEAVNKLRDCATYDRSLFFPWLKEIPFCKNITSNYKESCFWKDEMWKLWQEKINEVKKDIAEGNQRKCFISEWLTELKKRNEIDDPHKNLYSEFNLCSNLDIFTQATFETISTTILWCLQYLIKRRDLQKKLREEIYSQLIGKEFDLSLTKAKNFPYLRAVIQETHRLSSVSPFTMFHCTSERSNLLGYDVPQGITTVICTYSVHHNPENFPDPEEFKPERFLTEDGQFIRCEKVIPFSIGKRFCPGEFVAQMEIFHYLTAIIYEFELELGLNNDNFGKGKSYTLVNYPLNFTIVFKPLKEKLHD